MINHEEHISANHQAKPAVFDGKSLAIGVLSVTAAIFLVGFALLAAFPRQALAFGQNDRSGDYIILTQQISNSIEGLVVIDAASKRMCLYGLDLGTKQLRLMQRDFPLDKLPGSQEGKKPERNNP